MSDQEPSMRAEMVGGPLDGKVMDVEGVPDVLWLGVPPGPPTLAEYGDPSLSPSPGAQTAMYVLVEREVVDTTFQSDPLGPRRITLGGKYRYHP